MPAAGLEALNDAQRRAVTHGVGSDAAAPLLVIAGAGSGKTSTLAHRVAHLVRHGADPQRLLLLTFSRRAAAELERRAGQALHALLKGKGVDQPPALPWAGTFHSVGARILREYADRIGLDAELHDPRPRRRRRPDGARAAGPEGRLRRPPLPERGGMRGRLLAGRQLGGGAARRAARRVSVVRGVGGRAAAALRRVRRREAGAADPRLRRPAAVLVGADDRARAGRRGRRALRPRAGRRVPGHEPPAGGDPQAA